MVITLTPIRELRPCSEVNVVNEQNERAINVCHAIWDTGAQQTCISEDIAKDLDLPIISRGHAITANGDAQCYQSKCAIILSDSGLFDLHVVVIPNGLRRHVLIGMDIIKYGKFTVEPIVKGNEKFIKMVFVPYKS